MLLYMIVYYCKYVVFLYVLVHDCTFLCVDVYFAKTLLASWVWKGFVYFKTSLPGLKNTGGVGGGGWGGRSPPPFANTMLASWVWKGFIRHTR